MAWWVGELRQLRVNPRAWMLVSGAGWGRWYPTNLIYMIQRWPTLFSLLPESFASESTATETFLLTTTKCHWVRLLTLGIVFVEQNAQQIFEGLRLLLKHGNSLVFFCQRLKHQEQMQKQDEWTRVLIIFFRLDGISLCDSCPSLCAGHGLLRLSVSTSNKPVNSISIWKRTNMYQHSHLNQVCYGFA